MTTLVAGRELDALVAEQVMGFCLHESGITRDLTHCETECKRCGVMIADAEFYMQRQFTPSTSIAAAWEVVEKSNARFEMFNNPIKHIWAVKFEGQDEWVTADSAPLAICLAALKAVRVEVER